MSNDHRQSVMNSPMTRPEPNLSLPPPAGSDFWDALAPHHSGLENNFFNVPSVRRMLDELRPPVLIVGAGQGLIVAELQRKGIRCDGVDLSQEMIRHAKQRRGLTLIHADARALPFRKGSYGTIIYATGVIDFMADEGAIGSIFQEGRRVAGDDGKIFVAFYRLHAAQEKFLSRAGFLRNNVLMHKEILRLHLLGPAETVVLMSKRTTMGCFRAALSLLAMAAQTPLRDKITAFKMRRIFRNLETAELLINSAPEALPYRDQTAIKDLFARLNIPVKRFQTMASCFVVELE
ncbi:MAG: hypothetical protein C5B50_02275 [Verrucomicrobia bacterium]|nr:MAG: hypothetical protein C5B50_02275 [Verrucomicrobiota bacterium]